MRPASLLTHSMRCRLHGARIMQSRVHCLTHRSSHGLGARSSQLREIISRTHHSHTTGRCHSTTHPPSFCFQTHHTVRAFNPDDFPVFLGTAVYSFEGATSALSTPQKCSRAHRVCHPHCCAFAGIGLLIPIHESTSGRARHHFAKTLSVTLVGVLAFLILFGCSCYGSFGETVRRAGCARAVCSSARLTCKPPVACRPVVQVETVVTLNLPHTRSSSWWVTGLQVRPIVQPATVMLPPSR